MGLFELASEEGGNGGANYGPGPVPTRNWAVARWQAEQSVATAIEFGMVALPFVCLLFGIFSVCRCFFTTFTLENAVWQAARAIRTGQVQQSQGDYTVATPNDDRKKLFKKAMCAKAPSFFDCLGKAVVIVQSNANFGSIVEAQVCNQRCHGRGGRGRL